MKRYLFIVVLWLIISAMGFFASYCQSQVVQIADVRTNGMWSNWKNQTVTWAVATVTSLPKDPSAVDYNNKQDWYIPVDVGLYLKATFSRSKLGEYGFRVGWVSSDGTTLWSLPVPCFRTTK